MSDETVTQFEASPIGMYIKKPIAILAHKMGEEEKPDWVVRAIEEGRMTDLVNTAGHTFEKGVDEFFTVNTLDCKMQGMRGAYVVQGTEGDLYPVKESVFERVYEPVTDYQQQAAN